MNAGATQKETTSASESKSTPNWLVAFIRRATRPSSRSMTIATKMASAASEKRPSTVSRSAKKPQKRLPVVRRLGRRTMPRPRFSRSSCQRRRRDPFGRRIILGALRRSRERSEDGDAAHHPVARPHAHLGAARHEAIGARAEANHPEALAGRELVARSHAADDAPGDGARDLHDRDAGILPLEIDDAPLVHATGVGLIGGDEAPARARDGTLRHHPIRCVAIHAIIDRRRLPTSSIECSASRRRIARNPARLAWFSSTHSRANWPDWISPRIFFISAFVASLTTRGPRV